MAIIKNSISFGSGFNITAASPIDSRMRVTKKSDLFSNNVWGTEAPVYAGMVVTVTEEDKVYVLKTNGYNEITGAPIAADYTLEDSWVAVGSGNGSLAVETYGEAILLATNDNIGQVIYVKNESEYDADGEEGEGESVKYEAAPYIVIGESSLMKLAASSASGNIEGDVAKLTTKVSKLEETVGDDTKGLVKTVADNSKAIEELNKIDHDAYITADTVLENKLTGEIDKKLDSSIFNEKIDEIEESLGNKAEQTTVNELLDAVNEKVNKVDGERLMTDAEGTKLAGIAEGAQVNVIEKIKVNGEELIVANSDKSVEITIPEASVKGITSKEGQILTLSEDGKLDTTLSIAYVKATESENAVLRLQGVDGKVISSIDATEFIKDGMIQSVALDGPNSEETGTKYLVITWNTDAGKDITRLDVSQLFNPYTAGNGINLNSGEFSIKLKAGEQYIDVDAEGLKTTQALWDKVNELDNAVLLSAETKAGELANTAEANAKKHANDEIAKAVETLEDADDALDSRIQSIEDTLTEKETKWDSAEQNAKDYADENFVTKEGFNEFETAYEEKLNNIAEGAQVNVIESVSVNGIEATIENKIASVDVNANNIKLGTAITNGEEEKYDAETTISIVLQGIQDSIRGAIAGGVNSVTSGDEAIKVNSADANNPVITLNVETKTENTIKEGHIEVIKGENGLYAAMYYDGDDAE